MARTGTPTHMLLLGLLPKCQQADRHLPPTLPLYAGCWKQTRCGPTHPGLSYAGVWSPTSDS